MKTFIGGSAGGAQDENHQRQAYKRRANRENPGGLNFFHKLISSTEAFFLKRKLDSQKKHVSTQ